MASIEERHNVEIRRVGHRQACRVSQPTSAMHMRTQRRRAILEIAQSTERLTLFRCFFWGGTLRLRRILPGSPSLNFRFARRVEQPRTTLAEEARRCVALAPLHLRRLSFRRARV
jgi:hypothetical protein